MNTSIPLTIEHSHPSDSAEPPTQPPEFITATHPRRRARRHRRRNDTTINHQDTSVSNLALNQESARNLQQDLDPSIQAATYRRTRFTDSVPTLSRPDHQPFLAQSSHTPIAPSSSPIGFHTPAPPLVHPDTQPHHSDTSHYSPDLTDPSPYMDAPNSTGELSPPSPDPYPVPLRKKRKRTLRPLILHATSPHHSLTRLSHIPLRQLYTSATPTTSVPSYPTSPSIRLLLQNSDPATPPQPVTDQPSTFLEKIKRPVMVVPK